MSIGIVTDSTADLPASMLVKLGVTAVPLHLRLAGTSYRDWRDIHPDTLYEWMRDNRGQPETSPPDVEDFVSVYRKLLGEVHRVVSVHLSGELSETVERARAAAREMGAEERVTVIDSRTATAALAEQVIAAARGAREGLEPGAIERRLERIQESMQILICPDSLTWLVRGGRIGRARGMIGTLLGLRPILTMQAGEIDRDGTTRSSAAVDAIVGRLEERFGDTPVRVALGMAAIDADTIDRCKERIANSSLRVVRGRVQHVGAVVGAHLGPGTITVSAYPDAALA